MPQNLVYAAELRVCPTELSVYCRTQGVAQNLVYAAELRVCLGFDDYCHAAELRVCCRTRGMLQNYGVCCRKVRVNQSCFFLFSRRRPFGVAQNLNNEMMVSDINP